MQKMVEDSIVKLILEKDLTANNIEQFREDLDRFLSDEDDMAEVDVDLTNTKNIDSVGVTFIVGLYKQLKNEGILFRITGASEDVKSLFRLMKLDKLFELED